MPTKSIQHPLRLLFLHGRKSPSEEMGDWGYQGTPLEGITAVHFTYGHGVVHFIDEETTRKAELITGWKNFDICALEIACFEDLISTREGYFGDWELCL